MAHEKDTHTGVSREIDKAQDAVGAVVGKASATIGGSSTASFVKNALLGDLYEIESARIATVRSHDPQIKALAQGMFNDHSKSRSELMAIVQATADLDAPSDDLDERRQGMIDNLKNAPDAEFDETFMNQQHAAHEESTELFRTYSDDGDNTDLKTFVQATLPVLERHLEHVEQVRNAR